MPVVPDVAGFPSFEIEFTKTGDIDHPGDIDRVVGWCKDRGLSDLCVFAHGWNNDMHDARQLIASFFATVRDVRSGDAKLKKTLAGRKFGVLAVLWPSKKFAARELIPSGAAGVGSTIPDAVVIESLERLKGVFDGEKANEALEKAKKLVPELEDSPKARARFVDLIRSALPRPEESKGGVKGKAAVKGKGTVKGGNESDEDASDRFFKLDGDVIMKRLGRRGVPGRR
jgi:hypothetical protein